MIDWEADVADSVLEVDGKPAIYEDALGNQTPLTVLFHHFYASTTPAGMPHDGMRAEAKGKISALGLVRKGGFLIVGGHRWLIMQMPQPDGTAWTTLVLGEADE